MTVLESALNSKQRNCCGETFLLFICFFVSQYFGNNFLLFSLDSSEKEDEN